MIDRRIRLAAVVAIAVLVADQATKTIVEASMQPHQSVELLPFFALSYVRNTGAAFGILAAAPPSIRLPLFIVVTIVAVGALVSFLRRTPPGQSWLVAALGGILGGALGNLVCRLRYGEVIDFLDLHWGSLHWPAFNVADSAITVGVAIVLLQGLRGGRTVETTRP
jgi:signal peptidase II